MDNERVESLVDALVEVRNRSRKAMAFCMTDDDTMEMAEDFQELSRLVSAVLVKVGVEV